MIDPFDYWRRAMRANMSLANSTMRLGEAIAASTTVVRIRSDMIAAGMRSPLHADYREFSTMMPEKISAFGKSGSATAAELQSTRSGFFSDWQKATTPSTNPDLPGIFAAFGRMATLGLETLELTARLAEAALKPIHHTVTANARRLG